MIIFAPRYGGLIARCPNCYCVLGYTPDDVDNTQHMRCPQCSFNIWVPLDPTYDGVIKEDVNIRSGQNNDK